MKVIEFLGPPGVGKTYLHQQLWDKQYIIAGGELQCRLLLRSIGKEWIYDVIPFRIIYPICKQLWVRIFRMRLFRDFLANHPEVIVAAGTHMGNISRNDITNCWHLIIHSACEYQLANEWAFGDEIIVFHDGLVQLSYMFSEVWENMSIPESWIYSIPCPDHVVHVDASSKTIFERMINRPKGKPNYFHGLEDEEAINIIESQREITYDFCQVLSDRGASIHYVWNDSESRPKLPEIFSNTD